MSLANQAVKQEAGYGMNSPLLSGLLEQISEQDYHEIMDVVPANQGVIDLFSRFRCKLYLPGCLDALRKLDSQVLDTPTKRQRALVKTIGLYKNKKASLDVILLWDLPNYLDKTILSSLVEYLLPHIRKQTLIHCYIHTRQSMPAVPGNYRYIDGKVYVHHPQAETITCPAYYQEVLHRMMAPFTVQRSILLSNGLQEYVLHTR